MYQGDGGKLGELGDAFFKLLLGLEAAQVEYDLVSEDILARHGKAGDQALQVGKREYSLVIIPPFTENLNRTTRELLDRSKVSIQDAGAPPPRLDGAAVGGESAYDQACTRFRTDPAAGIARLVDLAAKAQPSAGFAIQRANGDRGILFHQRRELAELVFLVNTSIDHAASGNILTSKRGVEEWDLYTGKIQPCGGVSGKEGLTIPYSLPPSGSKLLLLSSRTTSHPVPTGISRVIEPVSSPKVTRNEPNVLTLDFVDVTSHGESRSNIYFYAANRFVWQRHGLDQNPWDSAVQYKDELISKTFPAGSGFTATYKFTVEGRPPGDLAIVLERPDLYRVSCNGHELNWNRESWWLDRAFGRLPLGEFAQAGENQIRIEASPFTMFHELESAYLLGDFDLKPADQGFVILPPRAMELGTKPKALTQANNPDGTMWLSAGMGFTDGDAGKPAVDGAPWLVFDLGKETELAGIQLWNYNEGSPRDLTKRGIKKFRLTASISDNSAQQGVSLGEFEIGPANGSAAVAQNLQVTPTRARYLRLLILENLNGVQFPCGGDPDDNGFVGLAKARFFMAGGARIENVKVRASSELTRFHRLATTLVDDSGLSSERVGWNRQGLPFYAAGVTYAETFQVPEPRGNYRIRLTDWYGSVAQVKVNGKAVGYIDAPPWECAVGRELHAGNNLVEVIIFGTLKNTLGPHHGNPPLGSAWPGMFKQGPATGPPPGTQYSTVAYGLFAPFVLVQEGRPEAKNQR